jgi:hypothetical protein
LQPSDRSEALANLLGYLCFGRPAVSDFGFFFVVHLGHRMRLPVIDRYVNRSITDAAGVRDSLLR